MLPRVFLIIALFEILIIARGTAISTLKWTDLINQPTKIPYFVYAWTG